MKSSPSTPFSRSTDRDIGAVPDAPSGGHWPGSAGAAASSDGAGAFGPSDASTNHDAGAASGSFAAEDAGAGTEGIRGTAAVFCADPAADPLVDWAGVPAGFNGRLSLRSAELLGFAETVGTLERLGVLICWAQAQQARAAARLEELFARDIARVAGRGDPRLALSLAAAEAGAALNLPHMTAMRLVSESSRLQREHPQTLTRLAEGRIGYQHARIILDETQHVPDSPVQDAKADDNAGPAGGDAATAVGGGGAGAGADSSGPGEGFQPMLDLLDGASTEDNDAAPDPTDSRGPEGAPDTVGDPDSAGAEPVSVRQRFEADLLSSAEGRTAAGFGKKARRLRESRFPETISVRHRDALEKRRVCFEALPDGMSCLTAFLAAEQGQAIYSALSGAARAGKTDGDPRTMDQLRADALATVLLDGDNPVDVRPPAARRKGTVRSAAPAVPVIPGDPPALVKPAGPATSPEEPDGDEMAAPKRGRRRAKRHRDRSRTRTEVMVLINVDTLAGLDEAPAELNGYGPISPEAGRRMILHALSWTPLLRDPATGEILGVGRRRRIPAGLKRWLQARDGTCRFPGCAVGVTRSEIDHTTPWARGGPTEHSNLEHLCPKHHRFKTLGHWKARQPESGTIEWTSPTGQPYRTEAALDYRGHTPAGAGAGADGGAGPAAGAGADGGAGAGMDGSSDAAGDPSNVSGSTRQNPGPGVNVTAGERADAYQDDDPPPF